MEQRPVSDGGQAQESESLWSQIRLVLEGARKHFGQSLEVAEIRLRWLRPLVEVFKETGTGFGLVFGVLSYLGLVFSVDGTRFGRHLDIVRTSF